MELHEKYEETMIEGWMSETELQWLNDTAKTMNSIVEIGSWAGRSAHALLSGCKGTVTCVDTWEGSGSDTTSQLAKERDMFEVFQSNVGHFPNLKIIKKTSIEAASEFEDGSVDMVFIDAGHDIKSVIDDIQAWKGKATKMICGHDWHYTNWPDVVYGVRQELGQPDGICGSIWWIDLTKDRSHIEKRGMTIISIGMPTRGECHILTMQSLMGAMPILKAPYIGIHLNFHCGTYIHQMRNDIVKTAMEIKADYVMFIDSDMVFPSDGILKLLSHNKDVIGGNYNARKFPLESTVRVVDDNGNFLSTQLPTDKIAKVFAVPTGFMLIKLSAIKDIPHPFDFDRQQDGSLIGEDVNFCKRCNEKGLEVWCDPGFLIGHIGEHKF